MTGRGRGAYLGREMLSHLGDGGTSSGKTSGKDDKRHRQETRDKRRRRARWAKSEESKGED